jgi:hypothetical protein
MTRSVEKGGVLRQTRADDAPWQLQPICRANTLVSWRVKPNYPSNCLHCHHVFRLEHGVGLSSLFAAILSASSFQSSEAGHICTSSLRHSFFIASSWSFKLQYIIYFNGCSFTLPTGQTLGNHVISGLTKETCWFDLPLLFSLAFCE